jgi:CheY-like chemotaxis protein
MAVIDVTETGASQHRLRRALLVEDEFLIRLDLSETLRDARWEVVEASSADDAMRILDRDCDFNLILTDVHMPGLSNGIDLAHFSKAKYPDIKVVVMSGLHRPGDEDEGAFDLFLSKPIFNLVDKLRPLHGGTDD